MTDERIKRLNVLAKKAKTEGLTAEEKQEQQELRQEYLKDIRRSLESQLECMYIVDPDGTKHKVRKKDKPLS